MLEGGGLCAFVWQQSTELRIMDVVGWWQLEQREAELTQRDGELSARMEELRWREEQVP